jgi:hypothetical protein
MGGGEREVFGDMRSFRVLSLLLVQDTVIDVYMARPAILSPCHFLLPPGYHRSERFQPIALYIRQRFREGHGV